MQTDYNRGNNSTAIPDTPTIPVIYRTFDGECFIEVDPDGWGHTQIIDLPFEPRENADYEKAISKWLKEHRADCIEGIKNKQIPYFSTQITIPPVFFKQAKQRKCYLKQRNSEKRRMKLTRGVH